ncbi:Gfo/Idh/MocA family oxidoreductase [bacterium AH-315-E10]|nr:Gfo/Idh/MocA family oxidoreductase [bacterium AH-315-E10]
MSEQMKIGIIGCGGISAAYFNGANECHNLTIKSCADLFHDAAVAKADEFGCEAVSVDEMLADPEIEMVINLTVPRAHVEVGLKIIEAGKHSYAEKPFAVTVDEGKTLIAAAAAKNLRLGCAPDTFLGGGIQTSRKVIDDGWIGRPLSGTAFMLGHGHESWHANAGFFYDIGGGPMLDMGPYYVTALVNMLGPAKSVSGCVAKGFSERFDSTEKNFGTLHPVNIPTHYSGVIEFHNGALITVVMSFDVWRHSLPRIEIHGTEGSLSVPDPNGTGGEVKVFRPGEDDWRHVPLAFPHNARMIGVTDMVNGIHDDRPHRASGDLAFHVLEIMESFETSSVEGKRIELSTKPDQPTAFPLGLRPWEVD